MTHPNSGPPATGPTVPTIAVLTKRIETLEAALKQSNRHISALLPDLPLLHDIITQDRFGKDEWALKMGMKLETMTWLSDREKVFYVASRLTANAFRLVKGRLRATVLDAGADGQVTGGAFRTPEDVLVVLMQQRPCDVQ